MTAPPARAQTAAPPGAVVIEPSRGWVGLDLRELWRFRELAGFLALRDVKVRYKQSLLGVAWAVIQPLVTMLVFALLFGLLLGRRDMPTPEGVPYALSTYCALVPWQLFARALGSSGDSLVANQNLITKVYFPRLIAPVAPILAALVDFALAFAVLVGMLLFWGVAPGPAILALPLFVALALASALSVSLWLSSLNALYRDVRHAIPFLVQIWLFATPVLYTTQSVLADQPGWVRWVYGVNPMAGVAEGFRWALLGAPPPDWSAVAASVAAVLALLAGGLFWFRRMERSFADLV